MKNIQLNRGFGPLLIIIFIAAALAVGGGVYYSAKKAKAPEKEAPGYMEEKTTQKKMETGEIETKATTSISANVGIGNGSIRSLLTMGKDVSCTFSQKITKGEIKGTVYISGNMMRGDFTTTGSASGNMESHMIKNGDEVNVWSGNQGAKMAMSKMGGSASSQTEGQVNLDQKGEYKCSDWHKDESKFSLPSEVKFLDINAMMKSQIKLK